MPLSWELQIHTTVLVTYGASPGARGGCSPEPQAASVGCGCAVSALVAEKGGYCGREAAQGPQCSAGMTD